MKRGSLIVFAIVLLFGATDLKSQNCSCSSGTVPISFKCSPYLGGSCNFSVPSGGPPDVCFVAIPIFCCGNTEYNYQDEGQCIIIHGKLDQPALQRLLEYAKTHEVLAASCNGQYLPAQAVLRAPTPALPPQSLERQRSISDLGAR